MNGDGEGDVRDPTRLPAPAFAVASQPHVATRVAPMFVRARAVLFEPGGVINSVYFPRDCVVSVVAPLHGGTAVEVATVGNEGVVGVPQVFGGPVRVRAVCSVAGWADRMDASMFLDEFGHPGALHELVEDYLQALIGQVAWTAACNRVHSAAQRLSRWLLMCHDRINSDTVAITHELIGLMLGARRATVTETAGILQEAGLITCRPGQVTIVDRAGLEATACECYEAIATELDGVVQRAALRFSGRGDGA